MPHEGDCCRNGHMLLITWLRVNHSAVPVIKREYQNISKRVIFLTKINVFLHLQHFYGFAWRPNRELFYPLYLCRICWLQILRGHQRLQNYPQRLPLRNGIIWWVFNAKNKHQFNKMAATIYSSLGELTVTPCDSDVT